MSLTPYYVVLNEDRRAWLEEHGDPVWVYGYDEYKNAQQLEKRLGYWPEPIDVAEVESVPQWFDDEVPF